MPSQLYSIGITTIAGALTAIATSVTVSTGTGALFSLPTGGDWERCTLHSKDKVEVIHITARTGDVLTVLRGREGSTAQVWSIGDDLFAYVTIREQIISKFAARAAALSTLPVLRCQRSLVDTDGRFVSVWDGDDQAGVVEYRKQPMQMQIAIECIKKTTAHSIEANAIMGEIIKLILGTNRTFNGLALSNKLAGINPKYPDDGNDYTTITALFTINYETVLGDPYTQKTP